MTGLFILLGGMLASFWIVVILDMIGRREDRRSHK